MGVSADKLRNAARIWLDGVGTVSEHGGDIAVTAIAAGLFIQLVADGEAWAWSICDDDTILVSGHLDTLSRNTFTGLRRVIQLCLLMADAVETSRNRLEESDFGKQELFKLVGKSP